MAAAPSPRFALFVRSFGIGKLARQLRVARSSVVRWLPDRNASDEEPRPPRIDHARTLIRISARTRYQLDWSDIYGQPETEPGEDTDQ